MGVTSLQIASKGSACGPVIVPVFKTGGRRLSAATVGSTPTRFRHVMAAEGYSGTSRPSGESLSSDCFPFLSNWTRYAAITPDGNFIGTNILD